MSKAESITLGIVAGEPSGELLAASVVAEMNARLGTPVNLVGVGGEHLEELGLNSVFDPQDIALMGITSVIKALPKLLVRIRQVADAIISADPDIVLLIDSPDFSHRVASRIKKSLPDVPIVKYVAPTVWAWRPGRAAAMAGTIDHVLALYPFEPAVMAQLNGPGTRFVGHRLMEDKALLGVFDQRTGSNTIPNKALSLLLLPGSRTAEIEALLPIMRDVVTKLVDRGHMPNVLLPTLPRHEDRVRKATNDWKIQPVISTDRAGQLQAYRQADTAIAASGTVLLELALAGVPAISLYKTDLIVKALNRMITAWSAALPNLIADRAVIPEFYNEMIRPGMIVRIVEEFADPYSLRHQAVMDGYRMVREKMSVDVQPSEATAAFLIDLASGK